MTSVWTSPDLAALVAGAPPPAAPEAMPAQRFTLRRSGGRPIAFDGMLMLEHPAVLEPGQRTHALRLYEGADGWVVVEISLECEDGGVPHVVVGKTGSMTEAEEFLRCYDPSAQAAFTVGMGGIVQQAITLEREAMRLRADYDKALSALLLADEASENDKLLSEERSI